MGRDLNAVIGSYPENVLLSSILSKVLAPTLNFRSNFIKFLNYSYSN